MKDATRLGCPLHNFNLYTVLLDNQKLNRESKDFVQNFDLGFVVGLRFPKTQLI